MNQCWRFVDWTAKNKSQGNRSAFILIDGTILKNVICKTGSILSGTQKVNRDLHLPDHHMEAIGKVHLATHVLCIYMYMSKQRAN